MLESNQAAILIGFTTLIAGHFVNAELNRIRDDRIRREEKAALAAALKSELIFIQDMVKKNAHACRNLANGKVTGMIVVPNIVHMVKIYPHVLSKLYLLGKDAVVQTNATYMLIETAGDGMSTMSAYNVKGIGPFQVSKDSASRFADVWEELAGSMWQAIETLSKIAGGNHDRYTHRWTHWLWIGRRNNGGRAIRSELAGGSGPQEAPRAAQEDAGHG